VEWQWSLTALDFINIRANLLDATDLLEQAALDRYAFVREAYFQRRRSLIYDGNPPPVGDTKTSNVAPAVLQTGLAPGPAAPPAAAAAPKSEPDPAAASSAPQSEPVPPATPAVPSAGAQVVEPKVPANYAAVLNSGRLRVAAGY
jgi:phospholipid-binding lipoprotein MlaA